jgi:hypothetical protein
MVSESACVTLYVPCLCVQLRIKTWGFDLVHHVFFVDYVQQYRLFIKKIQEDATM